MSTAIQTRLEKLRQKLAQSELDVLLVSTPENRRYLAGFTGSAGYLLISPQNALLATDFRYVEQATSQAPDFRVHRIGSGYDWFPRLLAELDTRRVGFESQHLSVAQYKQLTDALQAADGSGPSLMATSGIVEGLRAAKDTEEMHLLQRAIDIADAAFEAVFPTIKPGQTERQVAWELEKAMREGGAESASFDIIVAAGPNAALPHHRPTERPLQESEPVVIDMGARYGGYCSDLSRTIILGRADETFRRVYDTVRAAQETAMATVQAGMAAKDADGLARSIIQEAGYGENFGHSLGHGVGLAVHEFPGVGPQSSAALEDGMVFTVEPGIYLSGWGGVRIEDVVTLENGKARVLSHAHKRDQIGG